MINIFLIHRSVELLCEGIISKKLFKNIYSYFISLRRFSGINPVIAVLKYWSSTIGGNTVSEVENKNFDIVV